ncbi:unnamed protein product [Adineta ricciae]|uniref:Uncharacterized protein n=1 Tax=Adineta ricciae TaxID=249248 RepID=A0A813PAM9_ADIRI|nr:unnamed protein product [Adineta ricciae]
MSVPGKKRRYPTASSPNESDDDNGEQPSTSTNQLSNKRRGSVAADFAPHRLIVSERQQMAVLKQLTAGDESNTGSQSPSSITPQPRPSKINRRNEHGETIVHIAARKGDLKQLRKVLKAGAHVNEADNAGWTPLHEAVTKNQFKAARLLLKSGANSNAPGPEGQTPLVDAVLNNNTKMAELLLTYSADPSVVDLTRLNETMASVLRRETTVLESSDNENDDESISPLSPLTSDNDQEHDDKQHFHSSVVEQLDKDLGQHTTFAKIQRKKPYSGLGERSSQTLDSSPQSKIRSTSGSNEISASGKNPYDFESEEEGEIREPSTETPEEQKKKPIRKPESTRQRAHSGTFASSVESSNVRKRSNKLDQIKEQEQQKIQSTSDDEQLQHIYRVPPLKIVLARAVLQKTLETESSNPSNMNDDNNNLTISPASPSVASSSSALPHPIIEQNEKLLSSMSTDIPIASPEPDEKLVISTEDNDNHTNDDSSQATSLNDNEKYPPLSSTSSPQTVISSVLDALITQIESNNENQLHSLPVIEDDQMDVEEDEDEEEENEDDEEEQETIEKSSSNKSHKTEQERMSTRISSVSKTDLKPTTRTLRSHARGKRNLSTLVQTSASLNNNNGRRVSSRRRALDNKTLAIMNERERKRRTTSERLRKDKDNLMNTDDMQTSSNSDDQTSENTNAEKSSLTTTTHANDEASSCSSTGAGDESSTSSSATNPKQSNPTADIDTLPPNKRRLRERNAGIPTASIPSATTDTSTNSTVITDNSSTESTTARDVPVNSIKQFLEIRQQIDKRHKTMLHEFVLPKVPKDFSETTMAKKSYLIASSFSSYSNTTPSAIGIKRLIAPHDLDPHLADVFTKQEDERYKMKIRHQVERDKLILSHEQEVLRLCGNATRSSLNQEIPFSYCSLLKDNEVYNNPSIQLPEKMVNNDYTATELGKRGKHRWNGRSFIKWQEDSNLKYKRLSCELNDRQQLEVDTLYSMQRMVWLKHLPKESTSQSLSSSGRSSHLLTERYLPKVEINSNFWTNWETSPF